MSIEFAVLLIFAVSLSISLVLLLGYPIFIHLLSRLRPVPVRKRRDCMPRLSIVVPCYNEVEHVEGKVRELLQLEYPDGLVQLVFIDSGSTDGTTQVLGRFASSASITLIEQQERRGKCSAINEALRFSSGEVIVLTDADARVQPTAMKEIVANFADPAVGAVVGDIYITGRSFVEAMNEAFYRLFRQKLREWESALDSASFLSGETLAVRRNLIDSLNEDTISDDLEILFTVRKKGYRCIVEPNAQTFETDVETVLGQISHKRRTFAGTLQAFSRHRDAFLKRHLGLFGMMIAPMYALRILVAPFLLLLAQASFLAMIALYPALLALLAGAFIAFIALYTSSKTRPFALSILYGFIVQAAIVLGLYDYITGHYRVLWAKKGR